MQRITFTIRHANAAIALKQINSSVRFIPYIYPICTSCSALIAVKFYCKLNFAFTVFQVRLYSSNGPENLISRYSAHTSICKTYRSGLTDTQLIVAALHTVYCVVYSSIVTCKFTPCIIVKAGGKTSCIFIELYCLGSITACYGNRFLHVNLAAHLRDHSMISSVIKGFNSHTISRKRIGLVSACPCYDLIIFMIIA